MPPHKFVAESTNTRRAKIANEPKGDHCDNHRHCYVIHVCVIPLIAKLSENVKKISFWVLVISSIFLLIAILLINSSIRLSVYAKRFTIKTMQMVGATKSFIRLPFIWRSVRLGILGATIALIGMGIVLFYLDQTFKELELLQGKLMLVVLFSFIFIMGIFISWVSTYFATQRFLNLRSDELYY